MRLIAETKHDDRLNLLRSTLYHRPIKPPGYIENHSFQSLLRSVLYTYSQNTNMQFLPLFFPFVGTD